jgi:dienelactone hydrolase
VAGTFISYQDGMQALEGYLVTPNFVRFDQGAQLPGVLIAPTWLNLDEGIRRRADRLAAHGYAVFIADLFGAGIRPAPPQSPLSVIAPFIADRYLFRRRLSAGLDTLRIHCRKKKIAAVGYCLGGCGVLELARSGAELRGVISLHGMLNTSLPAEPGTIKAKILVLHGDADPLVPLSEIIAFVNEMRAAEADWAINTYGNAKHSFTGEGIMGKSGPEAGLHAQSEQRSWQATLQFLHEVLA